MILVDAIDLAMTRPDRALFENVSVTIASGDRIGLVGINGTGKSTLLRVLAGQTDPEKGQVRNGSSLRIAFLDQAAALPEGSVLDAVGSGWEAEAVLTKLGLGDYLNRSIDQLSGGEAKRVALARALVTESDLLILDEPTNHLDLDTISWLEQRLAQHRGALLMVTHDRHVLDRVASKIVELDRGSAYVHDGGYAQYLEGKAARAQAAAKAESVRRNLAKDELAWLRRGAPARTSKPKARISSATAIVTARPERLARPADLHLEFPTPRLGSKVIDLENVDVSVPGLANEVLLSGVNLTLDNRERLGIVGANGAGKTSLLEVIARRCEPVGGEVSWGSTVELGYYTQDAKELEPGSRAREIVAGPNRVPDWTDSRLLEAFWFDEDAQWAEVETLSGGERRRLHLMSILASKPNVLLLDEPTNDLDIETLRALEDFLHDWPGAVVAVSHDRAFLERVVSEALVLPGDGSVKRWPGGYQAWDEVRRKQTVSAPTKTQKAEKAQKAQKAQKTAKSGTRSKRSSGRSSSTTGHLLRQAEKNLAKLYSKQSDLNASLAAAGNDHVELTRLGAELAEVENKLAEVEQEWLELSEERESDT